MKISKIIFPICAALFVSACGGGSAEVSTASPGETQPPGSQSPQTGSELSGRFVDSAVEGLQYETESQSGLTGSDGTFSYLAGEELTFSIGDIVLPTIQSADIITPLSVFSTDEIADIRVMNLARLLQTLDVNADPTDGITLSAAAIASATGLEVDFSSPDFDDQVGNLVANSGSSNTSLVDGMDALDHLQETLFDEGIEERPAPPTESQEPPDSDNTATHPLVGTSAEFSDLAHDVSGTLTVIDDRTLEVTEFNYDGGGITVFFYTGVDGNFRDGPGVGPIGPQLNGRPYINETIRLTIPSNLTLDDFNALSVWCIPFAASFGDAQL